MRAKEKKQHELGGKYSCFARCVRKFEYYQGKPSSNSQFLRKIAHALKKWYPNEAEAAVKRLMGLAYNCACENKRSDISGVLTFRDGESNDYIMLGKLRRFLRKINHWHDIVDYRLIMAGKKVKEYDSTVKEHWNLNYGPKPRYKSKRESSPPSMVDTILPVSATERLDPAVKAAGIGFEPECSIAQQIKKEAVK